MAYRILFKIASALPSLVEKDLANLTPLQKGILAIRYTLTMKILQEANTADEYLNTKS